MPYKNKEEKREYQRQWYIKNRESILEQKKQYYFENLERMKERDKRRYKKDREKILKYQKQFYTKNSKKILERRKIYYIENPKFNKQYRIKNRDKINENSKKYYIENRERILEQEKQYHNKNPEYWKQYQTKKWRTDLKYNLNHRIKSMIYISLKGNKKGRSWELLVGYTLADLIKRLKKTMPEGYTFQDCLNGKLHIDHIIPKSIFNFTRPEHTDFKRCWALSNLRLLPAKENISKGAKLIRPFQPALKI